MSGTVAEIQDLVSPENMASQIAELWVRWNNQRQTWREEKKELRSFLFATDTSKTSNSSLPWKNSTTLPKLTQIRDNLHANYISALFPNDDWLRWEGYTLDDNELQKREAIEVYMKNKSRESNLRTTMSQLLYDYIDYGNAFADVEFVSETHLDPDTEEEIIDYVGPRVVRIHPFDIVFDPTATSFDKTPKIVRTVKYMGELVQEAEDNPEFRENDQYMKALEKAKEVRSRIGGYTQEDTDKAVGYQVDGFGSMYEYFRSGYVEVLTFTGDLYVNSTGELLRNRKITVVDRSTVLLDEEIPDWTVNTISHVGWRLRPDNLWAMGPLDNLVGMQYRIDHLENLKADVFDLIAHPPLKIIGEVEDFDWFPGAEIHLDENADVQFLAPQSQALQADFQIATLQNNMEQFAGAPREAMGIRTPGEKTAFEVQSLQNAAGRIFQEKITSFEVNLLEKVLNHMLQKARRLIDTVDVVRTMDTQLGIDKFIEVSKNDITAKGKLRPIGARHFAAQAQLLQNLTQLLGSPLGATVAPHLSSIKLSQLVEDVMGLERFQLFRDNVALFEQAQTQRLSNQLQENVAVEQATPLE